MRSSIKEWLRAISPWLMALALTYGYVTNIVKLCSMTFDPWTGMGIARIIGIVVPPFGIVLGYF